MNWKNVLKIAVSVLMLFSLLACEKSSDGPVEKAGEQVDEAIEGTQDGISDAVDEINDATEDVKEGLDEATE